MGNVPPQSEPVGGATAPTTRRPYGKKHFKAESMPGLVISAPIQNTDFLEGRDQGLHVVDTHLGPVHSKTRKLIVLQNFEEHSLTITIFIFKGNGLEGKQNKEDFVSIRDAEFQTAGEGPHHTIISARLQEWTRLRRPHFHIMSSTSNAHITYPISFRHEYPCEFEGTLLRDCRKELIDLYDKRAPVYNADDVPNFPAAGARGWGPRNRAPRPPPPPANPPNTGVGAAPIIQGASSGAAWGGAGLSRATCIPATAASTTGAVGSPTPTAAAGVPTRPTTVRPRYEETGTTTPPTLQNNIPPRT